MAQFESEPKPFDIQTPSPARPKILVRKSGNPEDVYHSNPYKLKTPINSRFSRPASAAFASHVFGLTPRQLECDWTVCGLHRRVSSLLFYGVNCVLPFFIRSILVLSLAVSLSWSLPAPAAAQSTAFKQAVAEAAAKDDVLGDFYQARGFEPLWTGKSNRHRQRRAAFLKAMGQIDQHGLPRAAYSQDTISEMLRMAKSDAARGALDVELSRLFLDYARDIQTGVLIPARIDDEIVRKVPYRDPLATIDAFAKSSPSAFLKSLPPQSDEYKRLMAEKLRLERLLGEGGWGDTVPVKSLKPGASGTAVAQLRNRLIRMGVLKRTNTTTYDDQIFAAVQRFQRDHGLATDGVAGPGTMAMINTQVETRLTQVIVAMERERWVNRPLGDRHIWVNLTDFSAKVMDQGKVTFQTRSVIGAAKKDRRSPEFSDVMEFMVINPSWYVPRSIATKEYLPLLQENPGAVSHLEMRDDRGNAVSRDGVDFASFTESSFPFSFREPPSRGNALGLVKFMFPNRYNIYLHDTPAKNLFARERRAYSHGCIRLADPFDFAYTLLAKQTNDPQGFFRAKLATNVEQRVDLVDPVPVHLVYRTAFTQPGGTTQFRRDVYGRDAKIWEALRREGVVLRAVRS